VSFAPPTFNLTANGWRYLTPVGNPADYTTPCNLSNTKSRAGPQINIASTRLQYFPATELLVPKGTDIRGYSTTNTGDCVEVPAGSGRFYAVLWADDVGKGFPNEYRIAAVFPLVGWALSFINTGWSARTWPAPAP
jgi:hypothetical protein